MMDHASETTAIPMAVRGYIKRAKGGTGSQRDRSFEPYSPWTLVLDTETDTEELPAAQPLLIVQYRIYYERQLFQRGVAYDPETAWPEEVKTIEEFCLRRRYYCLTANQFRSLFYWIGYDLQAKSLAQMCFLTSRGWPYGTDQQGLACTVGSRLCSCVNLDTLMYAPRN